MIRLTRLNHASLVVNSDLIEHVDNTPDTVISMTTGQKFVVLETPDVVIEKIRDFRRSIGCTWRASLDVNSPGTGTSSAEGPSGAGEHG